MTADQLEKVKQQFPDVTVYTSSSMPRTSTIYGAVMFKNQNRNKELFTFVESIVNGVCQMKQTDNEFPAGAIY